MMKTSNELDRLMHAGSSFLPDFLRALRIHAWMIIGIALMSVLSTYVFLQFVNDDYLSTARLLVKLGRENTEVPMTVEKGGVMSMGVRKEEINSEVQILTSREILNQVVDTLGDQAFKLEPPPPITLFQKVKYQLRSVAKWFKDQYKETLIALNLRKRLSDRESAIVLLERSFTVERERDSDVISVSVKLPSPDLAVQVVDTLVKLYLIKHVEVRRDKGIASFFDTRLSEILGQINALDAQKLKLRNNAKSSVMSEEQGLLLRRLQSLYEAISVDSRELSLTGQAPLPTSPSSVPLALSSFPNLEQLKSKVTDLRIKRAEALQKFTEHADPIAMLDREISQIEFTMRQALTARIREQQSAAAVIERRLQELNLNESNLSLIEQDRAIAGQSYMAYAKRREDARIAEELDIRSVSNIAVLNAAERPIEPIAPKKLLIVALSFPFGLMLGLGLALLLEHLNIQIRDEHDVLAVGGITYLGTFALDAPP